MSDRDRLAADLRGHDPRIKGDALGYYVVCECGFSDEDGEATFAEHVADHLIALGWKQECGGDCGIIDEERLARALRRLRDEPPHGSLVLMGLLPLYSDLAPWEDAGNWESPFARILAKAYREDSDA